MLPYTTAECSADPAVFDYLASSKGLFGLPALSLRIVNSRSRTESYDLGLEKGGTDAVYKLGSLSKLVTAVAILLLAEDGRVRLDDPIGIYLDWLPGGRDASTRKPPTVHALLLHTADLPRGVFFTNAPTVQEILAVLNDASHISKSRAASGQAKYSNLGYVLLGKIVEAVTGQSFDHFVRSRIFIPLGMTTAGFGIPATSERILPPHHLWCFRNESVSPFDSKKTSLAPGPAAAMDLHASVTDFMRLALSLVHADQGMQILRKESVSLLLSRVPSGPNLNVGMGFSIVRTKRGDVLFEAAEHFGHSAVLYMIPHDGFAVVAATNRGSAGADLFHIVASVIRHRLDRSSGQPLSHSPPATNLTGIYYSHDGRVLQIVSDGCGVRAALQGEQWSQLVSMGNKGFFIVGGSLRKYILRTQFVSNKLVSICGGPHIFHREPCAAAIGKKQIACLHSGIYEHKSIGRVAVYQRADALFLAYSPSKEANLIPFSERTYLQQNGPFQGELVEFDEAGHLRTAGKIFKKTSEEY